MPSLMTKKTWHCDICQKECRSEREAEMCEERHIEEELDKSFNKIFPLHHPKDDRYKKHCVDCGIVLKEYQRIWDGVDKPYEGDLIHNDPTAQKELGGLRCLNCHTALRRRLVKSVDLYMKSLEGTGV